MLPVCVCICTQEDSKPDMMNPGSNSSGMGSGAGSSSAGSPASKPNTTTHGTEYHQPESNSSPASTHVCSSLHHHLRDVYFLSVNNFYAETSIFTCQCFDAVGLVTERVSRP